VWLWNAQPSTCKITLDLFVSVEQKTGDNINAFDWRKSETISAVVLGCSRLTQITDFLLTPWKVHELFDSPMTILFLGFRFPVFTVCPPEAVSRFTHSVSIDGTNSSNGRLMLRRLLISYCLLGGIPT